MKIYSIALNTFKEVIRDKIFYTLVFFAVLLLGSSVLMSELSVGERVKIIEDIALGSMSIFGVIIAIFVGIGLVDKEIQKKTVYTIVSKPINRYQFLIGKYLGLCLTLAVYVLVMHMFFLVTLYFYAGMLTGLEMLPAVLLTYMELLVITATALMFSTFSTPTLSAAYTMAVFVIGHLTSDLLGLANKTGTAFTKGLLQVLYYVLPNLDNFNIRSQVVHAVDVKAGYILYAVCYGVIYVCLLLAVATTVFHNRDFK